MLKVILTKTVFSLKVLLMIVVCNQCFSYFSY